MDRLTGLQIFVRVAETGSFSRAAIDLGLTQPTVTKHVSELERRLGVRLLNRNSRGVGMTEIGSLYFERCKLVLREFEATETIASNQRGDLVGSLRLGASMAFGRSVIAPLMFEFLEAPSEAEDRPQLRGSLCRRRRAWSRPCDPPWQARQLLARLPAHRRQSMGDDGVERLSRRLRRAKDPRRSRPAQVPRLLDGAGRRGLAPD